MIAGLAVALLLGGVANGVLPSMWQLASSHPLFWLDQLSYTRSALLGKAYRVWTAARIRSGSFLTVTSPVGQSQPSYAGMLM